MSPAESIACNAILLALWPNQTKDYSELTIMAYTRLFEPYTPAEADLALRALMLAGETYFPSTAAVHDWLDDAAAYLTDGRLYASPQRGRQLREAAALRPLLSALSSLPPPSPRALT